MMAYTGNYSRNNNNDDVTVSTYAPVSFINPDSRVSKSRLGIGYFNSIMKLAIANRSNTENPPKYDIDNQIIAYINFDNAYRLMCGIDAIIAGEIDNMVIPTNKALVKLSNGDEFNSHISTIWKVKRFILSAILITTHYYSFVWYWRSIGRHPLQPLQQVSDIIVDIGMMLQ